MAVWQKRGNGLLITGTGWPKVAALSSNTVAFIDSYLNELRTYSWDGTNWTSIGTPLAITSQFNSGFCAVTSTRVAAVDGGNDRLRMYELSGGAWSLVGNPFNPGFVGNHGIGLARISDNEIAYVDGFYQVLKTYAFDGTDWAQVGNGLTVSTSTEAVCSLAALSPGVVAYTHGGLDRIRTYSWNGADWVQVGNELTLFSLNPAMTALSSTRVAIANEGGDRLEYADWDGTNWTLAPSGDWFLFPAPIELPHIVAFTDSLIAFVDFGDTELTTYEFSLADGSATLQLADTTADFVQIGGDLITTLGATTASVSGTVVISGTLNATLANSRATFMGQIRRWSEAHTLEITIGDAVEPAWATEPRLKSTADGPVATFYNPKQELTLQGETVLNALAAYVKSLTLTGAATITVEGQAAINQWLLARATGATQTELLKLFEATLEALVEDSSVGAFAALVTEAGQSSTSTLSDFAAQVMDSVTADLLEQNTMIVAVSETLEAEAGDTVQALGHYSQNINDLAGAWLVFKTSGEVIQGWVMNVEGDRPFSEYTGFEFNSMTRIGDRYFGAADAGLYTLSGDTDAGAQIDAHLSSMMLDFGSTAQKRVVAAYLGYTSTGTVVLKVRSVDEGKLVEHWYEANEVVADAPRDGYRPLGRGLKSRYWQFELANVDGADFEIDKLELQPIMLSRRV